MRRTHHRFYTNHKKHLFSTLLFFFIIISLILLLSLTSSPPQTSNPSPFLKYPDSISGASTGIAHLPTLPKLAYFISGSKGDGFRVKRLLQALYHPRNYYLLHLDLEASDGERVELAKSVKGEGAVRRFGNVMVVGKADLVTEKGPTMIASTLHAVAVLLKQCKDWDWFVNLSADDYPLLRQDDILHIFSYLPRDLNFLEHTTNMGFKEFQRARPIIVDPGLYHSTKSGVFYAKEKRSMPSSFRLFTGSAWVVLTRPFLEFCVGGWDNLPRTLLLYYTNFLSSAEGYFHTLVCNHKEYQNTTVNHDLHYIKWDNPPKQHPLNLTMDHFDEMVESGAPFARKFAKDDAVLHKIDKELLGRSSGWFTPGGWCVGNAVQGNDPCIVYGSVDAIKPSISSLRLEKLIANLLSTENFRTKQCKDAKE